MKKVVRVLMVLLGSVLVLIALGYVTISPQVRVERSVVIGAAPGEVFPHVNSLAAWEAWSPWKANDPTLVATYSGAGSGVGAVQAWRSEASGNGSQRITASVAPSSLTTALDFGGMGTATSEWRFDAGPDGTLVTWTMESDLSSPPIARFFARAVESEVGTMYEQGLVTLKAIVEQGTGTAQ